MSERGPAANQPQLSPHLWQQLRGCKRSAAASSQPTHCCSGDLVSSSASSSRRRRAASRCGRGKKRRAGRALSADVVPAKLQHALHVRHMPRQAGV